jgi:hypothetical protein
LEGKTGIFSLTLQAWNAISTLSRLVKAQLPSENQPKSTAGFQDTHGAWLSADSVASIWAGTTKG